MKNNEKIKKIKLANSILGGGIKNKNAFTLIELLAIIVILAIIAVITVPIILNVIDNSKKGAAKDSAYGFKDAVNKYYVSELYNNQNLKLNGDYTITDKGELSDGTNKYVIPFSGNIPTGGTLTYENNVLKNGCITIDEYKATIENGEVTTVEKGNCGETQQTAYKCIRATELHTEECNFACQGAGIASGELIKYGKLGTKGEEPASGDAFDCDVNGDGKYDSETERFYYVSDLYESTIEGNDKFNDGVAVLIYYSNTVNGNPNNTTTVSYDSTHGDNVSENWHGPLTAMTHLPTTGQTGQWKNVSLSSNIRSILNEKGEGIIGNGSNILPASFNYVKDDVPLATRLLTSQELENGCGISVDAYTNGGLYLNCEYMLENTQYTNGSLTDGFWLETPFSPTSYFAWFTYADVGSVGSSSFVSEMNSFGARPVIEVLKTDIDY